MNLEDILAHVTLGRDRSIRVAQPKAPAVLLANINRRIKLEVERLGYNTPNTSAVERLLGQNGTQNGACPQNGTARQHNPYLHRKDLAFAHKKMDSQS